MRGIADVPGKLPTRGRWPKWLRDLVDAVYWRGFEHGEFVGRAAYREEIQAELELEMTRSDLNCPLCLAHKKLAETELALARRTIERDGLKAKLRGWSIRTGRGYRQTRKLG